MKCRICEVELNDQNHLKGYSYICKKCDLALNKKWIKQHPQNRFLTQQLYRDKQMMNAILQPKFKTKRFNFLNINRLNYLFENVLWENDNLNLDKWGIENES